MNYYVAAGEKNNFTPSTTCLKYGFLRVFFSRVFWCMKNISVKSEYFFRSIDGVYMYQICTKKISPTEGKKRLIFKVFSGYTCVPTHPPVSLPPGSALVSHRDGRCRILPGGASRMWLGATHVPHVGLRYRRYDIPDQYYRRFKAVVGVGTHWSNPDSMWDCDSDVHYRFPNVYIEVLQGGGSEP